MTPLLRACALDLRILRATHRVLGGITLVALALAAATGATYVALIPAALWATSTITGFFPLRDRDRLDVLQAALGITRRDAVGSRYLVCLAVPVGLAALFALVALVRTVVGSTTGVAMAGMGAGFMIVVVLLAAVQLAVSFRWSGPTGRLLSVLLVMALVVAPVMALGMGSDAEANAAVMALLGTVGPVTLGLTGLSLFAFALSWATTARAMARRDL